MSLELDRRAAAVLLLDVVERLMNPAEHADIEAWIDVRSEEEGGFLWLVAALSVRPSTIEIALRTMLTAPPKQRQRVRQQLIKGRRHLDGRAE